MVQAVTEKRRRTKNTEKDDESWRMTALPRHLRYLSQSLKTYGAIGYVFRRDV